jgi:hypothetical protein
MLKMVSLAMEGKLQVEGLQAMDEEDDLLTAMARELVTRQGVGEQAAEVWPALQQRSQPEDRPVPQPFGPIPLIESDGATEVPAVSLPTGPAVQLSLF